MISYMSDIALGGYFVGLIISLLNIYYKDSTQLRGSFISIMVFGFAAHSIAIAYRFFLVGGMPVTNMHESSSFFAWSVMVIFFFLHYRYRFVILGSFILPIVVVLMLSSSALPSEIRPLSPILQSYWLAVHTVLAFVGNASFAVASGIGVMYLIQERALKRKLTRGIFNKLPSVQILDEINYKLITLGFPLLTLAIITGALWAESSLGSYWRWDPKEVWSMITWLIYALILHLRIIGGWRGKKAAMLSILGFITVLFTYYGVNLLLKSYHSFQ